MSRPATLEEYRDLLLATVIRFLPLQWVSAFGARMGEREGRRGIAKGRLWVQRLRDNFARYGCIQDRAEQDRLVLDYTTRIGRIYAEVTVLQRLVEKGRVEVVGLENLQGVSQPVILACCHLAHWELAGYVTTLLSGPSTALYAPLENPVHFRLVMRARHAWRKDSELVPASPRTMRQLTRALQQGRNLLMYIDEERDGYIWSPSLGRSLPQAGNRWLTARLAVRHNTDIVPVHVEAVGPARYRVVIEPKLAAGDGDAEARVCTFAKLLDRKFDAWIREHPEQWYWLAYFSADKQPPARRWANKLK